MLPAPSVALTERADRLIRGSGTIRFGPHHTRQIRATTRHGMRVANPQSTHRRGIAEERGRRNVHLPLHRRRVHPTRPRSTFGRLAKTVRFLGFVLAAHILAAPAVWAGTGGPDLPWNTPFGTLLDALTGTTGRLLAGLMLVVAGVVWGFVRHEEGARRFAAAVIGIALVFGALQVVDGLAFAGSLF